MLGQESKIDILLEYLQQSANPSTYDEVYLEEGQTPLRTHVTVFDMTSMTGRKLISFDALTTAIENGEVKVRSATDHARGKQVDLNVVRSVNIEGESLLVIRAAMVRTTKISGGYEFSGMIKGLRQHIRPAHRIFAECVARGDARGWNQWCTPINHGVDLQRLNLHGCDLSQFDLCCANLAGSDMRNCNLSGANLSGANLDDVRLEGVVVDGADFFGAIIPSVYESIIKSSGLLERESVTYIDSNPVVEDFA